MPKSKGQKGIITIIGNNNEIKARVYQGSNALWDYMGVNAIESLT